jgi:hypothetical protein
MTSCAWDRVQLAEKVAELVENLLKLSKKWPKRSKNGQSVWPNGQMPEVASKKAKST